ncbi:ANTAR domain-containing protein [Streptomyces beigongshangae]|uniref:ANTAR domain-containing protein n=1 Tax=Streptomyces beigongshangae TaxID=2841597 RepID=UPI001C85D5BF|nr:ANTAR domain-containing protein [Streptomyces sp. REN17]
MAATVRSLLDNLRPEADEEERRAWAVACAHALGLGGIAVSLGRELLWFSDMTSARLEDLQFILGEGPSLLFRGRSDVRQLPDLDRLPARQWPQFAAEVTELQIAALFVWPVHIGAVQAGTMTGYRRTPGPLAPRQSAEGRLVADALADQLLGNWPAPAAANTHHGRDRGCSGTVGLHRAEVHQATGVLSARLGVPLTEALDRLRGQAYASGRSLTDTAQAVIERELPQ